MHYHNNFVLNINSILRKLICILTISTKHMCDLFYMQSHNDNAFILLWRPAVFRRFIKFIFMIETVEITLI